MSSVQVEDSRLSLDEACALFRPPLHQYEMFWEKSLDTKMLMAWSRKQIMLSFRGTASLANIVADVQVGLCLLPVIEKFLSSNMQLNEQIVSKLLWYVFGNVLRPQASTDDIKHMIGLTTHAAYLQLLKSVSSSPLKAFASLSNTLHIDAICDMTCRRGTQVITLNAITGLTDQRFTQALTRHGEITTWMKRCWPKLKISSRQSKLTRM